MKEDLQLIAFHNSQNPSARFDMIKLEDLYFRKDIDHSIESHHKIQFYIILFIESGKGQHSVDLKDYPCTKGTVITIRRDQIQKFIISKTLKGRMLLFTDEFIVSYLEEMETQKTMLLFNELLGDPKLQLNETEYKSIYERIRRIEHEYFNITDRHSLGIIRSELHILITQLFRIKEGAEQITFKKRYLKEFVQLQELVEANVFSTTRVQDYAKMMGVSSKTLNTITKSIVHKTAKEFVDEICTKQIKRLLINSQQSIKEIAYQTGFEETTNFYKYFRRQTQSTPEQFRASYA